MSGIDPGEVAAKLTKAQREAVLKCRDEWLNAAEIGASGAVLTALCFPPQHPPARATLDGTGEG